MVTTKQFESVLLRKLGVTSFNNHSKLHIIKAVFGTFPTVRNVLPRLGERDMLYLIQTKACRRCGGDLSLEHDKYGTYMECIQCGAVLNEPDLINHGTRAANKHRVLETVKTRSSYK